MSTVVQAIVAFDLTGKNSAVGIVLLGNGISSAILGPFGGAIAGRLSKKLVAAIGQTVTFAVFLVIRLLIAADRIELWHLVVGSFFTGASFAFIGPARQVWIAELFDQDLRGNSIALNASRIWAPVLGGFMVSWASFGAGGTYFVMAVLYVISQVTLIWVPSVRPIHKPDRPSVLGDIAAGVRYVAGEPRLRWMLTLFFLLIVLGLSSTTVLPGLVENEFNRDVEEFSILQTANAVGCLVASVLVASIAGSPRALPIYAAGGIFGGIGLALTGLVPGFVVSLLPMLLFGIGTGAFQTLNSAIIVTESDPSYFGRVSSLTFLAFAGFLLVSYPVGLLADAIGERPALVMLGLLSVASVILVAPLIARAVLQNSYSYPRSSRPHPSTLTRPVTPRATSDSARRGVCPLPEAAACSLRAAVLRDGASDERGA